ncbi:hypothetical protein SAZ11_13915 [Streptomyces sp. FXJ1.4098]|nr:hypothetical protein [Streptomyces sp. FXJ1.4098]
MERVEWWPFLISRGRRTPFRTVVVPDLPGGAADGLEPVLLDAAGGKPTRRGSCGSGSSSGPTRTTSPWCSG